MVLYVKIFNALLLNGGTTTDLTILNVHSWGTFFSSSLTQCHMHQPDACIFRACGNISSGFVRSETHTLVTVACRMFTLYYVAHGIDSCSTWNLSLFSCGRRDFQF